MIPDELLRAAEEVRAGAARRDDSLLRLPLIALAVGTVDHERMTGALDPRAEWQRVDRDPWLGASAWRRTGASRQRPLLLVLEPDTEGRLAAFLARWGEAVAAIYLLAPEEPAGEPGTKRDVRAGPLGPARLLSGLPDWGPHVLLLDRDQAPLSGAR